MIRNGYSRIQDFAKFNTGINDNLLNCSKLISHNDLPPILSNDNTYKKAHSTIISFISKVTNTWSYDRNVLCDLKRAVPFPNTVIQDYFNYRLKGCSKYYIPLLKSYIDEYDIRFPPALQNAVDAYFLDENDLHWDSGIKSVIKSVSSPKAIDTGFKIFLRQNWTPSNNHAG